MTAATKIRLEAVGVGDCDRVVAYTINLGKEYPAPNATVIMKGAINTNRAPRNGISLDDTSVNRFLDAMATKEHPGPHFICFYPHHGFVFYRADGTVTAHTTICLMCSGYYTDGGSFVSQPDYKALASLVHDIGLPTP